MCISFRSSDTSYILKYISYYSNNSEYRYLLNYASYLEHGSALNPNGNGRRYLVRGVYDVNWATWHNARHNTLTRYPVVWWIVASLQLIWQPAPAIPLASQSSSWRRLASCQCIPGCCPPISVSCLAPCRIVLASPVDLVTCPYHFSLRVFTVVKKSSWGPMARRVLFRISSLEI